MTNATAEDRRAVSTWPSFEQGIAHDALNLGLAVDSGPDGIAVFSQSGLYRYALTRTWDRISPSRVACWIMCNPSTADAFVLDPTIRRCVAFSKRERCTSLIVVNAYAYRSVKPDVLNAMDDAIGPGNYSIVRAALRMCDIAIAAWGAFRSRHPVVAPQVLIEEIAAIEHRPLYALRLTADGHPGHPLYIPADAPLIDLHPSIYFTTGYV